MADPPRDPTTGMTPAVLAAREPLPGQPALAFFCIEAAPGGTLPSFQAGQAAPVAFPSGEGTAVRWYSLASPPEEAAWRLLVARVDAPGGATRDLFALPPGSLVHVGTPAGRLLLERAEARRHLAFLAAGTGVAPFLSMLAHLRRRPPAARPAAVTLWYGVRHARDLAAREELDALAATAPFPCRWLPCISRAGEDPDFDPEGLARGRADRVLAGLLGLPLAGAGDTVLPAGTDAAALRALLPPGDTALFLCGHPGMIDGMITAAAGTPWEEALVYEKWW